MNRAFALTIALALTASVGAQDEQYTLTFGGPTSVAGSAGDVISESYTADLIHAADATGPGAQGWSIGVAADGGVIAAVTTDGTKTAEVFDGGFNKTMLTSGEGNEGAVSAVVLCFGCPAVVGTNHSRADSRAAGRLGNSCR